MNVHKGWAFPRGIYSEVPSPITTPEVICVMALTLQPIRGCPQHSRETGTRLSSANHRSLLSRFSWGRGDVCTQAKEAKKMKCYKRLMYKQFVQVSGLCGPQFLSYLPKRFTFQYGDAILVDVLVHQYGRRKSTKHLDFTFSTKALSFHSRTRIRAHKHIF